MGLHGVIVEVPDPAASASLLADVFGLSQGAARRTQTGAPSSTTGIAGGHWMRSGSVRGPRIWPADQVTADGSSRVNSGIRSSQA